MVPEINSAPEVEGHSAGGGDRFSKQVQVVVADVNTENGIKAVGRNLKYGSYQATSVSNVGFDTQRKTFITHGYAHDPLTGDIIAKPQSIGNPAVSTKRDPRSGLTTVYDSDKGALKRRKTENRSSAADLDGFRGPWASYADEQTVSTPTDEQIQQLKEWNLIGKVDNARDNGEINDSDVGCDSYRRNQRNSTGAKRKYVESSVLHITDTADYQGRTFMQSASVVGNTRVDTFLAPERCKLATKCGHSWVGHTKGVSAIQLFPKTGHLLLSASLDGSIKLWEYYAKRRCIRTYAGHTQAVRDICFSPDGATFLSCSYDRYILLWDTYSGKCLMRYTTGRIPYCVRFHPSVLHKTSFVAGMSDNRIVQWSTTSPDIVQEYNYHTGPVNTITFVDEGKRFITTSDDESIRVWEWEVPNEYMQIKSADMYSMPAVAAHPTQSVLACQSMDNQIVLVSSSPKSYKILPKKSYKGHASAGYAIQPAFSPDGRYLVSGDAEGKLFFWSYQSATLLKKILAHKDVVISVAWHPHEPSHLISASWDGSIKLWV